MIDLAKADRAERATGGATTAVWRVEVGHRRYCLRVFRPHERHVLERELLVMRAAAHADIPVPRVHAIGTHADSPALVLDWCAGVPLFEALLARPSSLASLGQAFGRMQAEMHRIPAPVGLRSSWIDWPVAAEPQLAARLWALDLGPPRLLHFDYHPLNVLADDGRLSAVIDWANAFAGDPRADFARTATVLRLMPRVERLNRVMRLGALALEAAWRLGYGGVGGDLALHYAWAGAALEADLAGRHAPDALEPIRRWTRAWRRRAGLPSIAEH